jgi:hypothetical protein
VEIENKTKFSGGKILIKMQPNVLKFIESIGINKSQLKSNYLDCLIF